jgi:predicted ribosomally synthesized peptide with nif11-like leader
MAGLKEFLEKCESDEELQKKVEGAANDEALLRIINEAGYEVTAGELSNLAVKSEEGELSDDELENVAGGCNILNVLKNMILKTVSLGVAPQAAITRSANVTNTLYSGGATSDSKKTFV